MVMWEYTKWDGLAPVTVETLDTFGAEGWELVAMAMLPPTPETHMWFSYIFKRPIPPEVQG